MYQGSNKTALSSQKSIAQGFTELMHEKEYSKISISEICQRSGVSRQTFYTLFESKENIVIFILAKSHDFKPDKDCECQGPPTLAQLAEGFTKYILSKKEILELLVKNNIIYMMMWSLYKSFTECNDPKDEYEKIISNMTADFIAAGLTTIAKHYVMNSDNISEEQLKQLIYDLFNGSYFPTEKK